MRRVLAFAFTFSLVPALLWASENESRRRAAAHPALCSSGVVASATGATDVVVDDRDVFFGDSGGRPWRVAKSGGTPALLTSMAGTAVNFLALDASSVYFQTQSGDAASVYTIPKGGGDPKLLVSGLYWSLDMIPDGDWLYIVAAGRIGPPPWPVEGRILRVRKDGSAQETLATSLRTPMAMRLEGDVLYFTEAGTNLSDTTGGVRRMPKNGGAITSLANVPLAWALAQDAGCLYVLRVIGSDLGAVDVVSKSDGSVKPLITSVSFEPFEPMEVVGGRLVFMHTLSSSSVRIDALPLPGGERQTIREYARNFPQFAADACAVYYSTPTAIERTAF